MKQSFYDEVDEFDQPLNKIVSYDEVHEKGLWCRGVHVIIYTPDKEIVMQKRSPHLEYHPGEIEISVGGGVEAGETPKEAALRETNEELKLVLPANSLKFIGKSKFNHRTKTQYNRSFIYSFAACVPKENLDMSFNKEEVSAVFLISEKKLRQSLRVHRIKNFGKISSLYAYWKYLLDAI